MKKQMIFLLAAAVIIFSSCSTIKTSTDEIPPSVDEFLQKNGTDFNNYEVSDLGADYNFDEQSYHVYEDIETLWQHYMRANPVIAFGSRIIDFGIVYDPEDSLVYSAADHPVPRFREGQIYILDLEFMGIYNIPAAFKVSRIDAEKKMMEFIYLKNNLSNGYQQIYLKSGLDSKGTPVTKIIHLSFYKSGREFRDKCLYPPFHKLTVQGFHENIFELYDVAWESR